MAFDVSKPIRKTKLKSSICSQFSAVSSHLQNAELRSWFGCSNLRVRKTKRLFTTELGPPATWHVVKSNQKDSDSEFCRWKRCLRELSFLSRFFCSCNQKTVTNCEYRCKSGILVMVAAIIFVTRNDSPRSRSGTEREHSESDAGNSILEIVS